MRKHIVKYSRGRTSAVMASLVIEEHGRENTIFLSCDTKEEAPDCYRFGDEVAAFLKMPITVIADGRSVTQLFIDQKMLGNNRMTSCSRILKQEIGDKYIRDLIDKGFDITAYEGMSLPDDAHRISGRREVHANLGVEIRFPLIERGLTSDDCTKIITSCWGIKLSESYEHFGHDNCLARGCVKGGLAYWGLLALYKPEVWEKAACEEDFFGHCILSTSRYGKYPDGSLRSMKERSIAAARKHEAAKKKGLDTLPLLITPCSCAA